MDLLKRIWKHRKVKKLEEALHAAKIDEILDRVKGTKEEHKESNGWLIACTIVCGVLIIGGIVYLIVRLLNRDDNCYYVFDDDDDDEYYEEEEEEEEESL